MSDRVATQAELERICNENGGVLRAEDVVDAARPHNSILHHHFEWNDSVAAEQYRQDQARRLIKTVVIPLNVDSEPVIIPFYVNERKGDGYVPVYEVLSDPQRHYHYGLQALTRAINDLRNVAHKRIQKIARQLEKERSKLKPET